MGMEHAFNKIICCTDLHLGKHSDSREHNEICLEFIAWAIELGESRGCDTFAFLGDWHDHRTKIGVETLTYSDRAIGLLEDSKFASVYMIIGNHDLFFRESRSVHSLPSLEGSDSITLVKSPHQVGDSAFVPWLLHGERIEDVIAPGTKYVFGHFELPGFVMNGGYAMPERKGGIKTDEISGPDYIFSGHFHGRQRRKLRSGTEVHYIGNCFPLDMGDAGDFERGCMVLDHGGVPEYVNWPNMPTYHKVSVSELDRAVPLLNARSTVKLLQDVEMTESERDELREYLVDEVGVLDVRGDVGRPKTEESDWTPDGVVDIDTLIVEWIMSSKEVIDAGLDPEVLRDMYLTGELR